MTAGRISGRDREYFFRTHLTASQETAWLTDTYGLSIPGSEGKSYFFHGTSIDNLPNIDRQGIFGIPENPTLSTVNTEQAEIAARGRYSILKRGLISVFKAPWESIEIPPDSWPEPIGWPSQPYLGPRDHLNLPSHLKDAEDLRQLPPDHLIGFYVVDQGQD